MKEYIYADNAATTKLDPDAFEAMTPYLLEEFGNASQPYSFSRNPKKAIKQARAIIAKCISAEIDEIYFTSGGTESDNWAIKEFGDYKNERFIITSEIEHHAILNACDKVSKEERNITFLPVDDKGIVSVQELIKRLKNIRENNRNESDILVSIMMANNEIGTIEPILELSQCAHEYGAIFHTDAVQAVGHIPIDVNKLGIDMLSASAHKFNGPKGIGFLYKRRGVCLSSYNDGGAQEFGLRAGTENVASIVAMAVALDKNCQGMKENERNIQACVNAFFERLDALGIDYIRNGALNSLPGNISLSFRGKDGESLLHRLDLKKIMVSTGSACDSSNTQISHVLKAIHLSDDYAVGTIRISLGKDNTIDEAVKIANALEDILSN
jgi:cysteine desulfurase